MLANRRVVVAALFVFVGAAPRTDWLGATATEMRSAGCTPVEIIATRPRDVLRSLPDDPHLSRVHCVVEVNPPLARVTDLNSRNGTYVRIKGERELGHGDYLFIGRKLLRVEMNTN